MLKMSLNCNVVCRTGHFPSPLDLISHLVKSQWERFGERKAKLAMKLLSIKLKVGPSDLPSSVKLVSNSLRGDVHHHPVDSCDASQCLTKDFVGTKTSSSPK